MRLYLSNLRLNICFGNNSCRGRSNINTSNILSALTVLIWVGTVTCEAFSLTEMIWFCIYSSWITVDDIKSRSQEKHVKSSSNLNSLLSHERSSLFQCNLNHFQASKLSLIAVLPTRIVLLNRIVHLNTVNRIVRNWTITSFKIQHSPKMRRKDNMVWTIFNSLFQRLKYLNPTFLFISSSSII